MGFFTAIGVFVVVIAALGIFISFIEDSMDERLKEKERELKHLESDLDKKVDRLRAMYKFIYHEDGYPPVVMKERIRL